MANEAAPVGGTALLVTRSILASGGASRCSTSRNSLTAASGPSTSMNTPSTSLPTNPLRPRPVAAVYTNGRKPTPWTIPSTRIAVRISSVTGGPAGVQDGGDALHDLGQDGMRGREVEPEGPGAPVAAGGPVHDGDVGAFGDQFPR